MPVFIAVAFSFNAGKAQTTWQGFSLTRWYLDDVNYVWKDETLRSALFQSRNGALAGINGPRGLRQRNLIGCYRRCRPHSRLS